MDRIIQAVDRQDRLVENLLTLSHAEPESCQAVPLPSLIDNVLDMLPADPRVRVSGTSAPPPAWGDAFRLSEVFTNLIQNALEATPSDGVVEVRMEAGSPGVVRATVRNTGTGLPAELRERIFQPFFTTKTRGTGLGLAIARQIVEAHRGRLDVISDGVSETTFIVDLPTQASPIPMGLPREEMVRGDRG
jgi:signal transduction histidine kinase